MLKTSRKTKEKPIIKITMADIFQLVTTFNTIEKNGVVIKFQEEINHGKHRY